MKYGRNIAAFPISTYDGRVREWGLSKREYFAGLALQGICVNTGRNSFEFENTLQIADKAVELADALIKELEK